MYLRQTCNIEFLTKDGIKYRLRGLHSYEAKKSVHQLVQTCKLELPLSLLFRNADSQQMERVKLIDKIKEGDKITIWLGYNDKNVKEFEGYIKRINQKMPLELECEDEMYLLRRIRLNKNFKKAQVKEVLQYIVDELKAQEGIQFYLQDADKTPVMEVFNFWMKDGCTGIQALQALENCTLMGSYLTEIDGRKTLYCGLLYGLQRNTVKYVFTRNTISLDDLKYNQAGDRTFKVEVRHVTNAGKVIKYEFGDNKGEIKKVELQGGEWTADSIKTYAIGVLKGLQSGGYKGKFTTFLIPNVMPGDIGICSDPQFAGRSGNYYISSVTTTFGSGARRIPEIEIRL